MKLRIQARMIAWSAALLSSAMFAAWPLSIERGERWIIQRPEPRTSELAALDGAAFRVPLWVAEPASPPPPQETVIPPPTPLRVQLLAILHEEGAYKAVVYEPDSDRILFVAAGDKIGARNVDVVDRISLTLRDESGTRTLGLKEGS